MKFFLSILVAVLLPLVGLANENTSNRIAVVVNKYLSAEITDNLNTYFQDLTNEGYEPILKEWSLEDNPSPTELKGYLKGLYEGSGLQGAVLIADLPITIVNFPGTSYQGPAPTDHYYMDLENDEWKNNNSGSIEKPVFTIDNIGKRAIWVSRLTVGRTSDRVNGNKGEAVSINDYLKKNHEFRIGKKLYKERSWNYIPNKDINEMLNSANYSKYSIFNKTSDFFLGDLSKNSFIKLLTEDSNELGQWIFHGGTSVVAINDKDYIYSVELNNITNNTAFLLPQSCWIGDYMAKNYFSGALLFSEKSGVQTLISGTVPTRIWPRDLLMYQFQEGQNFGNSYLSYLSSNKNWPDYLLNEEIGRVISGDGTLKRQRYLIDSDKIEPDEKTLRSSELRKEITPSYIMPLIMTLKFDFSSHKISWDKYYNEDYLTYRLGKIEDDGSETVIYEGKDNSIIYDDLKPGNNFFLVYVWNEPNLGVFTSRQSKFDPNAKNSNGWSLLSLAISLDRTEIVELLLKAGTDPNAYTNEWRPISLAIQYNRPDIVALLIIHGANMSIKDLAFALSEGRFVIAGLLIEAGVESVIGKKNEL